MKMFGKTISYRHFIDFRNFSVFTVGSYFKLDLNPGVILIMLGIS